MKLMTVLAVAATYFYYNWCLFRFAQTAMEGFCVKAWYRIAAFLMNYALFMVCSIFSPHLIINWMLFFLFLFFELWLLRRDAPRKSAVLALIGVTIGLAVNILLRNVIAAAGNMPLSFFDNKSENLQNMKKYPIALGFFLAGLLFQMACRTNFRQKLRSIFQDAASLHFLVQLLIAIYAYLCLNLLVYSVEDNLLILKLWGMKSCVFVLLGCYLAIMYAYRMSRLNMYREKAGQARRELLEEQYRERELLAIAFVDPLTGCESRQRANQALEEALGEDAPFSLCFLDLNGLKTVNDSLGHELGNLYILAVVDALKKAGVPEQALYRYGGDEFLILFLSESMEEAQRRLEEANRLLGEKSNTQPYPFSMSFSYGLERGRNGMDAGELIRGADSRMYRQKLDWKQQVQRT